MIHHVWCFYNICAAPLSTISAWTHSIRVRIKSEKLDWKWFPYTSHWPFLWYNLSWNNSHCADERTTTIDWCNYTPLICATGIWYEIKEHYSAQENISNRLKVVPNKSDKNWPLPKCVVLLPMFSPFSSYTEGWVSCNKTHLTPK